jgi:membrane dipeptidase
MPKQLLIDAHQDLTYNMLTFGRDYRLSAGETRAREAGTEVPLRNGHTLLGWPEYQHGRVAIIFATLFVMPQRLCFRWLGNASISRLLSGRQIAAQQFDLYHRLTGEHPDQFRLVRSRKTWTIRWLNGSLPPAENAPAAHPVGLVLSMESAEGIRSAEELEEFWEMGLRLVGPVWAGSRYCGGTLQPGGFTSEGYELLERMAELGYGLDIAHMNDISAQQALDFFPGTVIASHANARALLRGADNERHLTDTGHWAFS